MTVKMMKVRNVVAISVALAGLSASSVLHAAPLAAAVPVHAMFAKTKMVKFTLRNDSGQPLELKVGENLMTLDAGKTVELKIPVGTRVVANAATATHPAGSLLAEASPELDSVTIGIK